MKGYDSNLDIAREVFVRKVLDSNYLIKGGFGFLCH